MRRRSLVACLAVGAAIPLAGCTGGDNSPDETTEDATTDDETSSDDSDNDRSEPDCPEPDTASRVTRTHHDDREISAPAVTLSPGQSVTTAIDIEAVPGMTIGSIFDIADGDITVQVYELDSVPRPDMRLDSDPPKWVWKDASSVQLAISIAASESASPGAYEYIVRVGKPESTVADDPAERIDSDQSTEYEVVTIPITVTSCE